MNPSTERLSAALADRYRIDRELGAGGMATVYLAHDLKHDRPVAVKVLRPELAAVLGSQRFLHEIKVTANLQHPHILQLYDSGEAASDLYYVMPYIEGESLRDKLTCDRRLSIEDTLEITKVVASALDFAHKRGIIHRDIKPENILLQDGVALVADFGIAVALATTGAERLTEVGLSIGTPAYMSPEQVAGERDLDARSDVYSLACVTYEMLAGDPPFVAPTAQAVMAKHIIDTPAPVTAKRPGVSPAIASALAKALSKEPGDRYQSAGAFAAALVTETAAPARERRSIVVLPFANTSPDPANEYFADGLTEEIIGALAHVNGLRVISRNSALALKGTAKSIETIAKELGVTHALTGSVRRAGDALRVMAELVPAAGDTPIWSEKYSGTVADVFGIQEEIARKIAAALEVTLTDAEARLVAGRPIQDAVAHDCYLRARHELYLWTPGSLDRAERMVDQGLSIVGDNPLLLATKGQIEWMFVNVSVRLDERHLDRAAELAAKALRLDPDHYLGIFVRGLVAATRGENERALRDLYAARRRRPGDANVLAELCRFSQAAGLRHYWRHVDELIKVDPLSPVTWFGPGYTHWVNGRFDEAVPAVRRTIELAGARGSALHVYAAWVLAAAGHRAEAIGILKTAGADLAGTVNGSRALWLMHCLAGDADQALVHVTPELERAAAFVDFFALSNAQCYALIGRTDDAIKWLRIAVGLGLINYPFLSRHDVFLEAVRGDPRFQELMDEVKSRWEAIVEWEERTQVGGNGG